MNQPDTLAMGATYPRRMPLVWHRAPGYDATLDGCKREAPMLRSCSSIRKKNWNATTWRIRLKSQHTFRLTKGHACHSDMGRIFCCITADTVGWHDTVCGLSDAELIRRKYGMARYQEHRNKMFRSGLDGMLIELGKWGLGMRDVVSNINFFSKVTANASGELTFHSGNSKAGIMWT